MKRDASLADIRHCLRALHGLSEQEMADRLGCSRQYICQHIKGQRFNPEIQAGIAALLHVPVEAIFDEHERRAA